MFETAELGHEIAKDEYERQEPKLREELLLAQYELKERASFPVIVLVLGMNTAGTGETISLINSWMDARHIETHPFGPPTEEESERPRLWRYWNAMPAKGKIGVHVGGWYSDPIDQRVSGVIKEGALDNYIEEIGRLENMLVADGTLLVKFWLHLSKEKQRKRLRSFEKDPQTRWRVTKKDWERFGQYDKLRKVAERTLRQTSTGEAPWFVVEGTDSRFRNLTVGTTLLRELKRRLGRDSPLSKGRKAAPLLPPLDRVKVLDRLDLSQSLSKEEYGTELTAWQRRLSLAVRKARFTRHHSAVLVFEGNDAAGKGGSIRRITAALDPRQFSVIPIAAPAEEERAQPYLWRFYRHLPRRGRLAIFDRSWYGRVLVERVEGFCSEDAFMRAYAEINDFESQLVDSGVVLVKFWLAISKDKQLERFKEREVTPFKRFKISEEDYRNREKWDAYATAVNDMVERTSTEICPFTLVEANDKYFARLKVLRTVVEAIERAT